MTQPSIRSYHKYLALLLAALCVVMCSSGTTSAATLEISGPAGFVVKLNDLPIGVFPLANPLELPAGTYTISCDKEGFASYSHTIKLASDRDIVRLRVRLSSISKSSAVKSNIPIAGLGQFYMGKKTKGWLFLLAESGGAFTALVSELQRSDYKKDYDMLMRNYRSAVTPNDVLYYKDKANKTYQDMEDAKKMRDTGLIIAGTAWALSMLDALFLFPNVDTGIGPVSPNTSQYSGNLFNSDNPLTTVHASVRFSF